MDAQQFLAELGHIANAPGGVSKLREMILALAVQGSLVTQDPADTSATNQVSEIRRLSSLQRFDGKRRRTNGHNSAFIPDPTNLLPAGWSSVRICDIVRVLNGRAYSKQELLDSGTPVLRVGNLFTSHKWYFSDLELEDDKCCENGDLLYAWSASFGPFIWSGERVIFHYHIWKLDLFSTELLNKQYLYTYLLEKTQEIKASGHGISMAHMTKEKFEQLVVPLPPLKEQSRIVAKVDELMALCDQLEAQQQQRRSLQNKLRQSTLQAVAAATTPHELQATWARLADNFGPLFDAPDDVKALRDAIFELAMRGVLLPNATMDVVASEDELPGLPTGWGWKTLGELSEYITSGSRGWKDYIPESVTS